MIYTVTLNPALDKTVEISDFCINTVNRITQIRTDPGGKGINVSKVISKLGGQSEAHGLLAGHNGKIISSAIDELGISCDFTFVDGETRTNLKIIDRLKHTNTDINEPGISVNKEIIDAVLEKLVKKIKTGDIVVLSGSVPKGTPKTVYSEWITRLNRCGVKVFFDADGALLQDGVNAAPYFVKPNNDELSRLVGKTLTTKEEMVLAAEELLKNGIKKVVISLGGDGGLYITSEKKYYAKGLKVPVESTVGAGDSVVAALAFAEERGMTFEEAICLSTATGAANVSCNGTQAAEYSAVKALLPKVEYFEI